MINASKSVRYGNSLLVACLVVLVALGIVLSKILMPKPTSQAYMNSLWQSYKQRSWNSATGQTTNHQDGQTTSESQAYTLLRAVWQGDRPVFDLTWQWTAGHLQRPDKLFSWLWSPNNGNSKSGPNKQGSANTASDADTDIAMALLMAGQRWNDQHYIDQSKPIIRSIWQNEVVSINGQPYMAADNIEKTSQTSYIVVNPSYYSPAAYRLFAPLDKADNWHGLISSAYTFINHVSQAPLNAGQSAGLPPEWVWVDRHNGNLITPTYSGQTTDFSYNAFRLLWRIGLDWHWSHDPVVQNSLSQFGFLSQQWSQNKKILADYSHSGRPLVDYSSLAMYGGVLGYFDSQHSSQAKEIVTSQLLPLFNSRAQLRHDLDYYDNNWVWFGLALHYNRLPNLAKGVSG